MQVEQESKSLLTFKTKIVPYLFLAPNLIIFSIFIILPAIIGVYYSFTDFDGLRSPNWVGFENYRNLWQDDRFRAAMWNTIRLVVATVPIVFATSLFIALIIIRPLKARGFFRASYYWPVMISLIVVGFMWQWILNPRFGLLNSIIRSLGFEASQTLLDPRFAWWGVVFIFTWSRAGYYMIMFVAALLSVPVQLYEAAQIDGASKLQRFWYVTYPSIKPARIMVFILAAMEVFKIYPIIVTFTGGGPFRATRFTVQHIYETAFESYQVGYASAMSVIMLLFVTVFTGINFFVSSRGERDA